jgi:hypothetical protein
MAIVGQENDAGPLIFALTRSFPSLLEIFQSVATTTIHTLV